MLSTNRLLRSDCCAANAAELLRGEPERLLAQSECVDEHTADQFVVFMAPAAGTSSVRVPATLGSKHLEAAAPFAAQLAGATVHFAPDDNHQT